MATAKSWIRIDIPCGPDISDDLGAELADELGATVEYTPAGLRVYFDSSLFEEKSRLLKRILESAPNAACDAEWSVSEIPDEDWSETWKAHFKPLRVGRRFLVTPTWEPANPAPGDLVILIDPGRAFGTGHHETTRLCLEWLESWSEAVSRKGAAPPGSLLDVGTGSGILAMGAALLGFENIVGIDNDPEAIEVAVPNIELNGLSGKIRVLCALASEVPDRFDVVISNIQSLPLIRMSEILTSRVAEGGRLVLSGILAEQADDVRSEYENRGAVFVSGRSAGEWVLLEFIVAKGMVDERS